MTHEPLPLATIHQAVLEYLRGREDAVLFGAQAVNAYVDEPRMTQDVDILSHDAEQLADEIRKLLNQKFDMAVRVRQIGDGRGYRVYQLLKPKNRHLVGVRSVDVQVVAPEELIAEKVIAMHRRKGKPKSGTDWRDIALLLLQFPQLKSEMGPVLDRLNATSADRSYVEAWKQIVQEEIIPELDDEEFA